MGENGRIVVRIAAAAVAITCGCPFAQPWAVCFLYASELCEMQLQHHVTVITVIIASHHLYCDDEHSMYYMQN